MASTTEESKAVFAKEHTVFPLDYLKVSTRHSTSRNPFSSLELIPSPGLETPLSLIRSFSPAGVQHTTGHKRGSHLPG